MKHGQHRLDDDRRIRRRLNGQLNTTASNSQGDTKPSAQLLPRECSEDALPVTARIHVIERAFAKAAGVENPAQREQICFRGDRRLGLDVE